MKRYPNQTGGEGAFFVLNDRDAKLAGFDPDEDGVDHTKPLAEKSTADLQPSAAGSADADDAGESESADDDEAETESADEENVPEEPTPATGTKRRRASTAKNKAGEADGDKS